jgi:septal ring factor EnvC (AmiA/AmiB activator)
MGVRYAKSLTIAAACGITALWSAEIMASTSSSMQQVQRELEQMQKRMRQQRHQIDAQQKKSKSLKTRCDVNPRKRKQKNQLPSLL